METQMNKEKIKRAEVLSPAGDMERFLAAVNFGADAVYLAGKNFGMRTSPSNFSKEDLKNAIDCFNAWFSQFSLIKNSSICFVNNIIPF